MVGNCCTKKDEKKPIDCEVVWKLLV